MNIRNPRDFWAGAIYLALACVVLWIGRNYPQGSSERMGPGYFPTVLGWLLVLFGAISVGRSFFRAGEPVGHIAWRPLGLVLMAVVLFGLLLLAPASSSRLLRSSPWERRRAVCRAWT